MHSPNPLYFLFIFFTISILTQGCRSEQKTDITTQSSIPSITSGTYLVTNVMKDEGTLRKETFKADGSGVIYIKVLGVENREQEISFQWGITKEGKLQRIGLQARKMNLSGSWSAWRDRAGEADIYLMKEWDDTSFTATWEKTGATYRWEMK